MIRWSMIVLFGASLLVVSAPGDVYGPLLGIVADLPAMSLRPIRGILGAATIGDAIALDGGVSRIALSSRQSSAIVTAAGGISLASLQPDGTLSTSDLGMPPGLIPSLVAFSPSGTVAAIYDSSTNALWLKGAVSREVDLSPLPDMIALLAVSDGAGQLVAGSLRDRRSVFVIGADGSYRMITGLTEVTDLTFLGSGGDLAIADQGQKRILVVRDPLAGGDATGVFDLPAALDAPVRVATSADGGLLAVLSVTGPDMRKSQSRGGGVPRRATTRPDVLLGLLRLRDGLWNAVTCDCTPVTLAALRGNAVFRLTQNLGQPLWILDGDSAPARVVFIPAVEK
jgi:hypothetical protein